MSQENQPMQLAPRKEELMRAMTRPIVCFVIIASCLVMTAAGLDYPWYWDAAGLGYFGLFSADRVLDHRVKRKVVTEGGGPE